MNDFDFVQALMQAIDDGLVEFHEDENGEVIYSLTDKGHEQGQQLLEKYGLDKH